MKVLCTKL